MNFHQRFVRVAIIASFVMLLSACATQNVDEQVPKEHWLAGDHHIHSHYSVEYRQDDLPAYNIGRDGVYPIPMNALMAQHFGLS